MDRPLSKEYVLLLLLAFSSLEMGYFMVLGSGFLADEGWRHYVQIDMFLRGDYRVITSMVPAFHAIFALIAYAAGDSSLAFFRMVATIISFLSIVAFYVAAKGVDPESAFLKTLQYTYLPILFPLFPLLYTDVSSILTVVLMMHLTLGGRRRLSGIAGLISVLVRQINVVWVAFSLFLLIRDGKRDAACMSARLRGCWVHLGVFAVTAVFILVNGGFAVNDKDILPPSVSFGNVYFSLFLAFFLFLPLHAANLRVVARLARDPKVLAAIPVIFAFYMLTFTNTHPYNHILFFLRNQVLAYFNHDIALKAVFFIPVCYCILSLAATPLHRREFLMLYPLGIIALSSLWLIEQRYALVPFVLFILLRKSSSKAVEYSIIAINFALSLYLLWGISAGRFFL
jgi:alpha-1,2-glucosyltransferase